MEDDKDVAELRQALTGGRRVLLAGSPPGTFSALSRDQRIVIWPSSEPGRLDGSRVVPAAIGAVVLTKMLSHALSRNLHRQAKTLDIPVVGPVSDGGALRLLCSVFMTPAEESDPMPRLPKPPAAAPAPAAAEQPPVTSTTLQMLDDAIAELQLVRESVAAMLQDAAQRSADLETLNRLRALLK